MNNELRIFTENDPNIKRQDTAKGLLNLLNLLKDTLILLNLGTFDEKLKTYYLTYNATIYIMDIC
jgi:hypothetical protein